MCQNWINQNVFNAVQLSLRPNGFDNQENSSATSILNKNGELIIDLKNKNEMLIITVDPNATEMEVDLSGEQVLHNGELKLKQFLSNT